MKGRMETELGSILIDTDVIATYAGSVAVECFGICRHGNCKYERWTGQTSEKGQPEKWYSGDGR